MNIDDGFQELESFQFQLKFAGASGLLALYDSMRKHPTVAQLVTVSQKRPEIARRIYQRLLQLLSRFNPDEQLFDDETFFAYLVCLVESDIGLARQASVYVPRKQGLIWTRWLAMHIHSVFDAVSRSMNMSNEAGDSRASSRNERVSSVELRSRSRSSHRTVVYSERKPTLPVQLSLAS